MHGLEKKYIEKYACTGPGGIKCKRCNHNKNGKKKAVRAARTKFKRNNLKENW